MFRNVLRNIILQTKKQLTHNQFKTNLLKNNTKDKITTFYKKKQFKYGKFENYIFLNKAYKNKGFQNI